MVFRDVLKVMRAWRVSVTDTTAHSTAYYSWWVSYAELSRYPDLFSHMPCTIRYREFV